MIKPRSRGSHTRVCGYVRWLKQPVNFGQPIAIPENKNKELNDGKH